MTKPCPEGLDPAKWERQQAVHAQNRAAIEAELRASNSRPTARADIRAVKMSPPLVPLRAKEVAQ